MTWTKLGAEFPDEASGLSDAAFRTHVEALCWSNRRLLDQVVPKSKLREFAETIDPDVAIKELVESGWWQGPGDAWFIGVRFADWQRDACRSSTGAAEGERSTPEAPRTTSTTTRLCAA